MRQHQQDSAVFAPRQLWTSHKRCTRQLTFRHLCQLEVRCCQVLAKVGAQALLRLWVSGQPQAERLSNPLQCHLRT
jgi:hypothetical protein